MRTHLCILSQVFTALVLAILPANTCGFCAQRTLSGDKVLLDGFSIGAKKRLFAKVGLTNFVFCGYGQRDSAGDRLCFPVELRDENGQRQDRLVVVTADGVHVKPWHIYNELMTDNDDLAVWEERVNETNSTWRLRNNQQLPPGCRPESVSAEWIALSAQNRRPWLARLQTPTNVMTELPVSSREIDIFANGQTVHAFVRPGWRNAEGPMNYLVYDFSRGVQPITQKAFKWVRVVWDMDPETGLAVVNDNNWFWGRIWLLDVKTEKRKSISADWPSLILKKDVAKKWTELSKP